MMVHYAVKDYSEQLIWDKNDLGAGRTQVSLSSSDEQRLQKCNHMVQTDL